MRLRVHPQGFLLVGQDHCATAHCRGARSDDVAAAATATAAVAAATVVARLMVIVQVLMVLAVVMIMVAVHVDDAIVVVVLNEISEQTIVLQHQTGIVVLLTNAAVDPVRGAVAAAAAAAAYRGHRGQTAGQSGGQRAVGLMQMLAAVVVIVVLLLLVAVVATVVVVVMQMMMVVVGVVVVILVVVVRGLLVFGEAGVQLGRVGGRLAGASSSRDDFLADLGRRFDLFHCKYMYVRVIVSVKTTSSTQHSAKHSRMKSAGL